MSSSIFDDTANVISEMAILRPGSPALEDLLIYRDGDWTTLHKAANGTLLGYSSGVVTALTPDDWGLMRTPGSPADEDLLLYRSGAWGRLAKGANGTLLGYSGGLIVSQAPGTWGLVGGALGSTDNVLVRANGAGGQTAQGSIVALSDEGELSGGLLVHAQRTIVSSPDTLLATDEIVYFSGSVTAALPTTFTTGREVEYRCMSAGTLTLDPGGTDTVNGGLAGAALDISCADNQAIRVSRSAAGAWRAVLPRLISVYLNPGVYNVLNVVGLNAFFVSGTSTSWSS